MFARILLYACFLFFLAGGLKALPDLVITGFGATYDPVPSCLAAPYPDFGTKVWVSNQGDAAAGPFTVSLDGRTMTVATGLSPSTSTSLLFLNYSNQGSFGTAIADYYGDVAESDESNNTLTTLVPMLTEPITCTPWPSPTYTVAAGTATQTTVITATLTPTVTATRTQASTSYGGGYGVGLPGIIEAENYDLGGESVAYHDTDGVNSGGVYRSGEGVDLEACSDTGGGYDVQEIYAGEWLNYSVSVASSVALSIQARVASNGVGGSFHIVDEAGAFFGSGSIPDTGGWQNWQTINLGDSGLMAGPHVLKIIMDSNGPVTGKVGNINWIQVTYNSGGTPTITPTPTPAPAVLCNQPRLKGFYNNPYLNSFNFFIGGVVSGRAYEWPGGNSYRIGLYDGGNHLLYEEVHATDAAGYLARDYTITGTETQAGPGNLWHQVLAPVGGGLPGVFPGLHYPGFLDCVELNVSIVPTPTPTAPCMDVSGVYADHTRLFPKDRFPAAPCSAVYFTDQWCSQDSTICWYDASGALLKSETVTCSAVGSNTYSQYAITGSESYGIWKVGVYLPTVTPALTFSTNGLVSSCGSLSFYVGPDTTPWNSPTPTLTPTNCGACSPTATPTPWITGTATPTCPCTPGSSLTPTPTCTITLTFSPTFTPLPLKEASAGEVKVLGNVKTRSRGEFRISVNPARKGRCALEVFSGFRRIRRVFAGDLDIGPNALRWDQKDDDGRFVRAGSYKVVFTDADGKKTSTRCVIVR